LGWTLVYMLVILKIPLIAALVLIWYAVKQEPSPDEDLLGEEGGPWRKLPPRTPSPRRGPVGGAGCRPAPCPQLVASRLGRHAPVHARRS
jgi:hypothetical protein